MAADNIYCYTPHRIGCAACSEQGYLEEITVTAQKRQQNIQDIPVAVTALSGEHLVEHGITDLFDLQQTAPGLIVDQSQNATTANFSIRGVGTSSQNFGLESSVGLYVDGVYRTFWPPANKSESLSCQI